jgi:hypothetical protein
MKRTFSLVCMVILKFYLGTVIHPCEAGGTLAWAKTSKLGTPLTKIPDSALAGAATAYKNIVGWMNDRPVQESKRAQLA